MVDNGLKRQRSSRDVLKILLLVYLALAVISSVASTILVHFLTQGQGLSPNSLVLISTVDLPFGIASFVMVIVSGAYAFHVRNKEPFGGSRSFALGAILLAISPISVLFPTILNPFFIISHATTPNQLSFYLDLSNIGSTVLSFCLFSIGIIMVSRPIVSGKGRILLYLGFGVLILMAIMSIANSAYSAFQLNSTLSTFLAVKSLFPEFKNVSFGLNIASYAVLFFAILVSKKIPGRPEEEQMTEVHNAASENVETVFEK